MAVRGREVGPQLENCTPPLPTSHPGSSQCLPRPQHTPGSVLAMGCSSWDTFTYSRLPSVGRGQDEGLPHRKGAGHTEGEKAGGHPDKGQQSHKRGGGTATLRGGVGWQREGVRGRWTLGGRQPLTQRCICTLLAFRNVHIIFPRLHCRKSPESPARSPRALGHRFPERLSRGSYQPQPPKTFNKTSPRCLCRRPGTVPTVSPRGMQMGHPRPGKPVA